MQNISWQDLEEIKALKSQYFYWLDMQQWTALRSLFTDNAEFEGFPFEMDGPDAWVHGVQRFFDGVVTQHRGAMPHFQEVTADRVKGRWSMTDYLTWQPGSRTYRGIAIPGMYGIHGYGYYEEEYVRTPSGWRIAFMRLTRVRIDPLAGSHVPTPDYDVIPPTISWLEPVKTGADY
ncbi:nuclear transport factor 2 family protein [Pseudarthrobacter sp. NPDC089323]